MKTETVTIDKTALSSLNLVLPVLAFIIPFFVSGPQILTGSLVNCFLFLSAAYSSKRTSSAVIFLPSIAALLNGLVFGKFTPFLAYFLPFIWIGNFILISTYKKNPTFVGMILSALLKSLFLFIFAFVFFKLSIVPQIFLTAMGLFQFFTAIFGGILFLGINKLIKNH
ncbi:hypothetical protein HZA76_00720 [Candidatus Roizmanbacteria bacterium]|nr:hypothetical protein [Candidatus Roizmanbacteria bacterium]